MRKVLILFFLLFLQMSYSQNRFSVEILSGFGFNNNLTLFNEEVENYTSSTVQFNLSYRFKIIKEFFIETGLGTQLYFSSGNIRTSRFKSSTLRLKLPVLIGYNLFKKVSINTGVAIANNREFNDLDFRANYNLRTSFLLKGNYSIKDNFEVVLLIQKNISDIPDLFFINQPNLDVSLGVSYKLF